MFGGMGTLDDWDGIGRPSESVGEGIAAGTTCPPFAPGVLGLALSPPYKHRAESRLYPA